jgi:intracellular sulfur oxidation DsrE/DsrF family protein
MKTLILLIGFLLSFLLTGAQTKPVKIVFDVTSRDTLTQQTAIRHVTLMAESYPESYFEVVIYGGALNMVVNGKSTVSKAMKKLEGNAKVSFMVCEYTMKRAGVEKSQLLTGVGTVPDGIIEIVTRQGEGWGYIKEAHN